MSPQMRRHAVAYGLVIVVLLALWPATGHAADCRTMIAEYFDWIRLAPGQQDGAHTVGVKMASAKIRERNPDHYPWGHGSYAEGRLGWHDQDLTGRLRVLFSDRKSADRKYRFDPGKSDIQDVTVFADGRVRVVLVTWGSPALFLEDLRCHGDGFITGVMREINGVSIVSLVLRKEVMHPDRDGFRDWP